MKLIATALSLVAIALVLVYLSADELPGLSERQITLVTDVDGKSSVIKLQMTTAKKSDQWVIRSTVPWLEVIPASGAGTQQISLRVKHGTLSPGNYDGNLTIRAPDLTETAKSLKVTFKLHAARGVSVYGGNQQLLVVNTPAVEPFEVQVRDTLGNPLADVPVLFKTVAGVTHPAQLTVKTDAEGRARFQPTPLQYGAVEVSAGTDIAEDAPAHFKAVATGWTSTFAGDGLRAYGGDDGPAVRAHLNSPFGMALLKGDLLVMDYFNHALRRIDLQAGTIHAVTGNGKQGFSGDGGPALDAVLNGPFGFALNPQKDIVIGDYYNNRIRAIDSDTGTIVTIAGNGIAGYSGDGGEAVHASIDVPLDIVADSRGNIYLSDWHHHVVRKLDVNSGIIDTIAGVEARAYTGKRVAKDEGLAKGTGLSTPLGMSLDKHDNLYIADYGNNMIRRIDAQTGEISTVAGTGHLGFSGDGEQAVFAQLNRPYNVYADDDGGLFISDVGNHRVRHVDLASGIITTIAGNGVFGYSPTSDLAVNTEFKGPFSVIKDSDNTLYIAEYFGHRIRKIAAARAVDTAPEPEIERLQRQARDVFGNLPIEAVSAENPVTDEKIVLGKTLFHDASLSRDGSVSCSSCHQLDDYGVDGLELARGIRNKIGLRNSPSVFNAALQDSQFWDGRVATVEEQAREPLLHPSEMGMPDEASLMAVVRDSPRYQALFARAFPDASMPINFANLSAALGAFERRLLTPDAAIDRFVAGDRNALSAQQLRGLGVFFREGCASCHAGPLLGGQDIHLIEDYPDTVAGDQFEFRKRLGNTHKFKVAPLRNIARTGPYLHDGRYQTLHAVLRERLNAYMVREAGIRDTVDLADGELDALVAFMDSLTGQIDLQYIAIAK
ncbi:Ig-like domain-containing protein [Gammaproteobacteria bacterium]|nr:Ig-like domain-containing protein [Gammaproteobacteria bacterium]